MSADRRLKRRLSRFATVRLVNPLVRVLIRRFGVGGSSDDPLRSLRVRGRTTGRPHEVPIRVTPLRGERYIVGMFATAQWVKNLRARGEADLILGRDVERIRVRELEGDDRDVFLLAYARDPRQASRLRFALRGDPRALSRQKLLDAMAPFPVFKLERSTRG